MAHYEIEIKSLLGGTEKRDALLLKMQELDSTTAHVSKNKQLNHYFEGGDFQKLLEITRDLFDATKHVKLESIIKKGKTFSVRTRQKNEEVLLVLKASVDEGTSANTVSRLEFEEAVSITLAELDKILEEAGFVYQAKWSRERDEYSYRGANVCIDRNAGYGYLAEFEKVLDSDADIASARTEIESLMSELGVSELPQDRLERMFDHYNKNWRAYYGTEKVFTIE